ncbi:MAG: hypothetical protein FWG10_07060 [Eubacteriaceae bacterium]|nr:hypothetical protein [Eubacteriaceae bacterium]
MYIDNHPGEIAEEMFPPFEAIEDVAASVASRRGELEQEDGIFRVIYSDWRGEYEMEFFPYVSHSSLAISHVSPEGPILRHVLAFDTQYCYLQLWSSKRPDFRKNLIFKGGKGTFSDRYGYADIFNNVPVGFPF